LLTADASNAERQGVRPRPLKNPARADAGPNRGEHLPSRTIGAYAAEAGGQIRQVTSAVPYPRNDRISTLTNLVKWRMPPASGDA
jgi:hypothetical protein